MDYEFTKVTDTNRTTTIANNIIKNLTENTIQLGNIYYQVMDIN